MITSSAHLSTTTFEIDEPSIPNLFDIRGILLFPKEKPITPKNRQILLGHQLYTSRALVKSFQEDHHET